MAQNPYDRRHRRDARNLQPQSDFFGVTGSQPSPMAREDLDALAGSAYARGRHDGQEATRNTYAEILDRARFQAWEEGHEAGEEAGLQRQLAQLNHAYEKTMTRVHQKGMAILKAVGANPRDVTKRELEVALDSAIDVIAELIGTFADGDTTPIPF